MKWVYAMEFEKKKIERQIQNISSKHCRTILAVIEEEDGISQGELAKKLNLLPSGLSVVLKKMETCEIPLVCVHQIGKYRRYSLPDYMQVYLNGFKESEKNANDREEESLFLLLQRFVEYAGKGWKEEMNRLLLAEELQQQDLKTIAFFEFMEGMKEKTAKGDESVNSIKIFINNEVLVYLIDKYIEADS